MKKPASLAKARAYREKRQTIQPGSVLNKEPGWTYYVWVPDEVQPPRRAYIRRDLEDRGYEPVNGPNYSGEPRLECVYDIPNAELWRIEDAVARDNSDGRRRAAFADPGFRFLQEGRVLSRGGFIPEL